MGQIPRSIERISSYRSKDPTNSIKVLKEKAVKGKQPKEHKENTNYTYAYTLAKLTCASDFCKKLSDVS